MDQLTFKDIEIGEKQAKAKELAAQIERRLKTVALATDRKTFAAICDKSYSYISEILNTNSNDSAKAFRVEFIPAEIIEAPDLLMAEVINPIADFCGWQPSPGKKSPMKPEEELEAIKKKIRDHGLDKLLDF